MIKKRAEGFFFLAVFAFLAFIMYCTPRSSDDFEFLSLNFPTLKSLLRYALYYGNGRALGNITAIVFNKVPFLAIVAKAGIITSVIYLLPRVLKFRGLRYDLFSFLLVLCVNPAIFGEVYTWNCGFANYMPPIFITLLIVYLLQTYPCINNGFVKIIVFLAVFGFGVAGQLFVEHTSIANVLLSAYFTLTSFKRKKSEKHLALTWLAATLIGMAAMLLIPKVFYIANNRTGSYRSTHFGSIGELLESCFNNAIVLLDNCIGTFGLLLSGGALISLRLTRNDRSQKAQRVMTILASVSLGFILLSSFMHSDAILAENSFHGLIMSTVYEYVLRIITAIMALIPFVIWILTARRNKRIFIPLLLAVISMIMLLPVSPTPTRVVYQAYLLVSAAFLCTLALLPIPQKHHFTRVLCVGCCALSLMLTTVFFNCHSMAQEREEHILRKLDNGDKVIEIFEIPYQYVFWDSQWAMHKYYDPTGKTTFEMVDYTVWHALYVMMGQ